MLSNYGHIDGENVTVSSCPAATEELHEYYGGSWVWLPDLRLIEEAYAGARRRREIAAEYEAQLQSSRDRLEKSYNLLHQTEELKLTR